MIQSMTAFARLEAQLEVGEVVWELRSVNHRYLELHFKLPEAFRKYEPQWRDLIKSHLKRGKVECCLVYKPSPVAGSQLCLNEPLALQLLDLNNKLNALAKTDYSLKPMDIMRWPDCVSLKQQEISLEEPLTQALDKALSQLVETRAREGKATAEIMSEKLAALKVLQAKAQDLGPVITAAFKEKIQAKLATLKTELDANRLEQELVLFMQKVDVAEELDRLLVHVQEVTRTLSEGGPVGRRLDFMMQELNREANTLASKSPDPGLTQIAVDIKVCIEQIREQIQNLE